MPAHPEDELLADLAADVLPIDVARQVEAHVMTCARCFQVLSDAESVRVMLRQAPPEAMPPQVLSHLEQALTAAQLGREPQPMPRRAAVPQGGTGPMRRDVRSGQTGAQTQRPRQTPQQAPQQPAQPQRQRPLQPGRPAQPVQPAKPVQPAPPVRPTQPGQAGQPVRPGQQPNRPVQPGEETVRPAARQAESNTTSYRVRPLKRPESETAYPADGATAVHPAVRADGPDPELTQPVRKRRVRPPGTPDTSAMTQQMRPVRDKGPGKLTRMDSTQAIRVRRQALEEQKADEPSRWPKISPQIAAAVVLVMALAGGLVTWQVRGGGGSAEDSGGAASSASAPILTSVLETGTEYQKDDLKTQVDALVETRNSPLSAQEATASPGPRSMAAQGETEGTGDMPEAASGSDSAAADSGTLNNGQLLKDPEALQACLKAIDREGAQPVAVDLATYNGREAALIVLPGTSGGYDVWIVARTCQPGNDGTVDVVEVDS